MSTTGKVLSVLVTLVAVLWVALSATVTQLNRNGAQALEALKVQVAKLDADLKKVERSILDLKNQTAQEQHVMQNELAVLQGRQAEVEKARSGVLESLSRVKFQLADVEKTLKDGQAQSEERLAEKNAEIKAKAAAEASVEAIRAENARMLARLNALRQKFRSTLAENKSLVSRLQKGGEAPRAKKASVSR